MENKFLKNLVTLPINIEEINSEKDDDQYFYQDGWQNATVASAEIKIGNKTYTLEVVVKGEQRVFICMDEDENIVPLDEEGGEYELVRLYESPSLYLEAKKLERESGEDYFEWGNNCWLELEIYDGEKLIAWDENACSSIYEVLASIEPEYVQEVIDYCREGVAV